MENKQTLCGMITIWIFVTAGLIVTLIERHSFYPRWTVYAALGFCGLMYWVGWFWGRIVYKKYRRRL